MSSRSGATDLRAFTLMFAAAGAWIAFRVATGIQLEDALITYRYALNLASGDGFVFNPGERVLGTTTPLLTVVLGSLSTLVGPDRIAVLSTVLMIGAATAALWVTYRLVLGLGYGTGAALATVAALGLHPDMLWASGGGMETPLVLLLMAWGALALVRQDAASAAASAGLLVLTRADGVVWAGLVFATLLWTSPRRLPLAAGVAAAIVLPWTLFATWYFGSPVPHSVIAKRVIGAVDDPWSLSHVAERIAWNAPYLGWAVPFAPLVGGIGFVWGAVEMAYRQPSPAGRLLVAYPLVFSAALFVGRSPLYSEWHLLPAGFCALIVGVVGLWRLGSQVVARLPASFRHRTVTTAMAAIVAVAWVAGIAAAGRENYRSHRAHQINEDGTRRVLGDWLSSETPPDATVAMEAIGYQGFFSQRRIIDMAGLVSPDVVRIHAAHVSNAGAFHSLLAKLRPGYLVLRSFEVDRNRHWQGGRLFDTPAQQSYFGRCYEEVRRFRAPIPRLWSPAHSLTVFRRAEPGPGGPC